MANFGIPAASDSSGMDDPGPFEFDGTGRTAIVAAVASAGLTGGGLLGT